MDFGAQLALIGPSIGLTANLTFQERSAQLVLLDLVCWRARQVLDDANVAGTHVLGHGLRRERPDGILGDRVRRSGDDERGNVVLVALLAADPDDRAHAHARMAAEQILHLVRGKIFPADADAVAKAIAVIKKAVITDKGGIACVEPKVPQRFTRRLRFPPIRSQEYVGQLRSKRQMTDFIYFAQGVILTPDRDFDERGRRPHQPLARGLSWRDKGYAE